MTPLDVALRRALEDTEKFLRGASMLDVSTYCETALLAVDSRLDVWQSWVDILFVCFDLVTVFRSCYCV